MSFKFYEKYPSLDISQVFCARIDPEIRLSSELLKSFYYLLWFPGYFGFNWDALNDCLCDFSWIDSKKIAIIHEKIPELPDEEKVIYLDILNHAILSWKEDNTHDFDVYFKQEDKKNIEELLALARNNKESKG
ncbi:barstar family protein [Kosakonia sp.]|uniref:barstar family protein n=2 Tax=Enterobacteriaceae TaxID=543 RepID=UPI0028A65547|nr:barstar family protein [Kosakonia sp.]